MGVPLSVTYCFPLAGFFFSILSSLVLVFAILITVCLGIVLFGLIVFGTVCAS